MSGVSHDENEIQLCKIIPFCINYPCNRLTLPRLCADMLLEWEKEHISASSCMHVTHTLIIPNLDIPMGVAVACQYLLLCDLLCSKSCFAVCFAMLDRIPGNLGLYTCLDQVHGNRAWRPRLPQAHANSTPSSHQECLSLSSNPSH